jgi:hypothetical protein
MNSNLAVVAACLLVLVIMFLAMRRLLKTGARDGFYTEHGQEEPTRSYVPYTGTLPFGAWEQGHLPWAEAFPAAPHYYRSLWGPGATWL